MSTSAHVRRLKRKHRRPQQQPKLNLVALMDIFTILVLFLMVNNGDVEVLQADKSVVLPDSISESRPEVALTIKVTDSDILVQGRAVESIDAALAQPEETLAGLSDELRHQSSRDAEADAADSETGRPIIIMGHRDLPYKLLKRIMSTCAEMDYRDISLAVNSKPEYADNTVALAEGGSGL